MCFVRSSETDVLLLTTFVFLYEVKDSHAFFSDYEYSNLDSKREKMVSRSSPKCRFPFTVWNPAVVTLYRGHKRKFHTTITSTSPSIFALRTYKYDRGSTVVKVLCYKLEGRWFDSRWCHWNFLLTKSFRSHSSPGVDSVSNKNEYQEYFLGAKSVRYVRLTTLPPSWAIVT